jgi:hypothetical protein
MNNQDRTMVQQQQKKHQPPLSGGYAPIPNLYVNSRVQEVAQYVIETLYVNVKEDLSVISHTSMEDDVVHNSNEDDMDTITPSVQQSQIAPLYTFVSTLAAELQVASNTPNEMQSTPLVVRGTQQVVAGMNYRLIIVLVRRTNLTASSATLSNVDTDNNNNNSIVGAFEVVVYDQFGTLSVSKWGKEVSMTDATLLLQQYEEEVMTQTKTLTSFSLPVDEANDDVLLDNEGHI